MARRPAPASDIYSLGVCAYQFLSGRLPHEYGSLTELALKQQSDIAPADHELPARGAAGARPGDPALPRARPRAGRYASALEMADARGGGPARPRDLATQLLEQTQALGYDPDATRATMADTGATQALPASQRIPPRTDRGAARRSGARLPATSAARPVAAGGSSGSRSCLP